MNWGFFRYEGCYGEEQELTLGKMREKKNHSPYAHPHHSRKHGEAGHLYRILDLD